jgi:transcriptional regulator with XRE-family HTH domain
MVTGSLGERIAAYRRRRGLSQATLAGLVGRSESWLSQVERGIRSVDRLSVLLDLARVLRVDVEALLGRPWQYAPNGGHEADELAPVRAHFFPVRRPPGRHTWREPDAGRAADQRRSAHVTYQAANYQETIAQLPSVLTAADAVRRNCSGGGRREAHLAYVSAYVVAAKLLTKLGATDLAMVAADRSATASLDAESLTARGLAAYQVACALLRGERADDAEHLAVSMAEQTQAQARSDEPALVSVAGALWLIAAIIAARRTERFEAHARLDRAEGLAGLLGHDANHAWTAFGPTNVAIHRVSVAAELGDASAALDAATAVDPDHLPEGLSSRRAQMHLDLAWAQSQRKRDAEAVLHLLEAERTAPEAVHYNVVVRELIREMLARQTKTRTSSLHDLAVRAGVLG